MPQQKSRLDKAPRTTARCMKAGLLPLGMRAVAMRPGGRDLLLVERSADEK